MELGEKLRQARQEAGLSQRQLCGEIITRNMLSLIENGTARPSMDTLCQLAERLGKPVSWFLQEDAVLSPNQDLMARARRLHQEGKTRQAWLLLQDFRHPDEMLAWEWRYLRSITAMEEAKTALRAGKERYARQLLEQPCGLPELERQRLLALGAVAEADLRRIVAELPSLDEELLLRAEEALSRKDPDRAAGLLGAVEEQTSSRWKLLRGECLYAQKRYADAAAYLQQAETDFPAVCIPLLEACFRETGDYKRAYEYACKQR